MVLGGDHGCGVGKTSLVVRYYNGTQASTEAVRNPGSSGIDFRVKTVSVNKQQLRLKIWDAPPNERASTINPMFFRNVVGIILVFDVTDRRSLISAQRWWGHICRHTSERTCTVLVGNKCDLESIRTVSFQQGSDLARKCGIPYFETSAQSGQNVNAVFFRLLQDVQQRHAFLREDSSEERALKVKAFRQNLREHEETAADGKLLPVDWEEHNCGKLMHVSGTEGWVRRDMPVHNSAAGQYYWFHPETQVETAYDVDYHQHRMASKYDHSYQRRRRVWLEDNHPEGKITDVEAPDIAAQLQTIVKADDVQYPERTEFSAPAFKGAVHDIQDRIGAYLEASDLTREQKRESRGTNPRDMKRKYNRGPPQPPTPKTPLG